MWTRVIKAAYEKRMYLVSAGWLLAETGWLGPCWHARFVSGVSEHGGCSHRVVLQQINQVPTSATELVEISRG